mmetsp:Transcript_21349/g.36434  ORF Transcript_21349/g.36434 Transcript_21349/m.36434 type:complete len:248 (-) Transcript_21349:38-781(-)
MLTILFVTLLAASTLAVQQNKLVRLTPDQVPQSLQNARKVGSVATCTDCVDFFADYTGTLLKAVLEGGVGTCGALCSYVPLPSFAKAICDIGCIGVGFYEFTQFLNTADLDPVYVCAEVDFCPKDSCTGACTEIVSTHVTPSTGKLRSKFTFSAKIKALKQTGTGLTVFALRCPQCNQQGQLDFASINTGFSAGGVYSQNATLDTAEDDWQYPPGLYEYEVVSCKYACSDQHGAIWAKKTGSFHITA